jgi:hypothetical protein
MIVGTSDTGPELLAQLKPAGREPLVERYREHPIGVRTSNTWSELLTQLKLASREPPCQNF